jgi:hypothetical protein
MTSQIDIAATQIEHLSHQIEAPPY